MCSWDTGEWNSLNCFVTLCCFRFLALGTNLFNYSALRQALVQVLSSFLSFAFRTVLSSQAFPRVVDCEMEVFGVSGSITKASGICTLPINVVNEKIYLVLWLTFVLASLLSLVQVLHQALLVAPSLRPYIVPHLSPSPLVSRQVIGLPLVHISSPMITRYSCLTIQATRLMRRGSYGNMVERHFLFLTDQYLSSDYPTSIGENRVKLIYRCCCDWLLQTVILPNSPPWFTFLLMSSSWSFSQELHVLWNLIFKFQNLIVRHVESCWTLLFLRTNGTSDKCCSAHIVSTSISLKCRFPVASSQPCHLCPGAAGLLHMTGSMYFKYFPC